MRWTTAMGALILLGIGSLGDGPHAESTRSTPPVERTVLPNGLRVLVIPQRHLPMIVVSALVDAGGRFDARGKEGLASLTAALLTEGTEKRSSAEIHDAVDFLGARLSAGAGDDYASVALTVLQKDLQAGMD
ncbi:MAG: M16 family metallopeptidase, partial [Candidatus Binatia bacterium]